MNSKESFELEINRIMLAGLGGEKELKEAITPLIEKFNIVDNSPTSIDISKDLLALNIEYLSSKINDDIREQRLIGILKKALTVKKDVQDSLVLSPQ